MRAWWILAGLALAGCPEPISPDTDGPVDTDDDTGLDTGDEVETVPMTGRVLTPEGEPYRARVNMCLIACYTVESSPDDGSYTFDALPLGDYHFYVVPFGAYPDRASSSVPFTLASGDAPDKQVVLPLTQPWQDLPATAEPLELAPGLTVTMGLDTVEPFTGETKASAAVLDPADLPDVPVPEGTIVAAWYLGPLLAEAADGAALPYEIDNTWGGTDGETYEVYTGKYAWDLRDTLTLTGGKLVGTDLHDVVSLLVVRPD